VRVLPAAEGEAAAADDRAGYLAILPSPVYL
jgi:hypothetical protein